MNKIMELARKREAQAKVAKRVGHNTDLFADLTDHEVRVHNLAHSNPINFDEIFGVPLSDIYKFAEEYSANTGKNILDASLGIPSMPTADLSWSIAQVRGYIKNRIMDEKQYTCLENAAEIYKAHNGEAPRKAI